MRRIDKHSSGNDLLDYLVNGGKLPSFMGDRDAQHAIRRLRALGYKSEAERELEERRERDFWED